MISGQLVVAGESEDDLRAVGVVVAGIDVLVLVDDAVGTELAVKDILGEGLALGEAGGTREDLGVEEDAHLEDAVEGLVAAVDGAADRECGEGLVEFLDHPVADVLVTFLEGHVLADGFGEDAGVGAGGQRDAAAEDLEDVVVAVDAEGADLGDVSRLLLLGDAESGGVDAVQVVDEVVAESDGGPGTVPDAVDVVGQRGPGVGGKDELVAGVPTPGTAVPGAPCDLVCGEFLRIPVELGEVTLLLRVDVGNDLLDGGLVREVVTGVEEGERMLLHIEAARRGEPGKKDGQNDAYLFHNAVHFVKSM